MESITVDHLLGGTLIREGAGVKLHRYIGADRRNAYEPILLFDYFNSREELDFIAGFPPHPHRGFETITYVLEGSITHEDNQGHKGEIGPGAVQWMTAGKGIIHSEMPKALKGQLHGLQLWLNLPALDKLCDPKYQEYASSALPIEEHDSGVLIKIIAGTTDKGTSSPITAIATNPLFLDITLPKDTSIKQIIPKNYQALLFTLSGRVGIQDNEVSEACLGVLSAGELLQLDAKEDCRCLLIAARRLGEPIVRHGPFVMNTQEEVLQALNDFRSGLF
jgi:redox-sensitive bicupin YhaK (pirin superfamily)